MATSTVPSRRVLETMDTGVPAFTATAHQVARPHRNVQVGDLVLVLERPLPRHQWPVARVTAVHPGQDGLVRSARIRTTDSELLRPVTKLYLLEEAAYDRQ